MKIATGLKLLSCVLLLLALRPTTAAQIEGKKDYEMALITLGPRKGDMTSAWGHTALRFYIPPCSAWTLEVRLF